MTTLSLPNHVLLTNSTSFQNFYALFKSSEQDKKFTTILVTLFTLYFVIAVIVPFVDQVEIPKEIKEQIPVQLAKIVLKEKLLLPEKLDEIKKEKVKEERVKKTAIKKALLPIENKRIIAKEKAKISGLAAMKDELFSMREAFDIKPSGITNLREEKTSEVKIKRKLIASNLNKQSTVLTAVKTANLVNSDVLSTRNTQKVRLSDKEVLANTDVIVEEKITVIKSGQRSEVSLRRSLEANKARLYARYNRALRKDPFLQGKVLFEIEIQPNGKISNIVIKSSELNSPKLERQLLVILRSITFPAASVAVMKTIWAIDFLPS
jgi:outer membrane biosynthesis protein TonB